MAWIILVSVFNFLHRNAACFSISFYFLHESRALLLSNRCLWSSTLICPLSAKNTFTASADPVASVVKVGLLFLFIFSIFLLNKKDWFLMLVSLSRCRYQLCYRWGHPSDAWDRGILPDPYWRDAHERKFNIALAWSASQSFTLSVLYLFDVFALVFSPLIYSNCHHKFIMYSRCLQIAQLLA